MPCSGSSTSPLPVMMSEAEWIGHGQHGLQFAQHAVGAPVFGQLNGCAHQVALVLFQLGFKALKQGNASAVAPAKPARTLPW